VQAHRARPRTPTVHTCKSIVHTGLRAYRFAADGRDGDLAHDDVGCLGRRVAPGEFGRFAPPRRPRFSCLHGRGCGAAEGRRIGISGPDRRWSKVTELQSTAPEERSSGVEKRPRRRVPLSRKLRAILSAPSGSRHLIVVISCAIFIYCARDRLFVVAQN
jgi:hypothetical protein